MGKFKYSSFRFFLNMKKNIHSKRLAELAITCLLVLTGLWLVFFLPYDKQYGYHCLLESCGRRVWNYSRIFENKNPVDVAFIGSSRTICAVQDSLLENILPQPTQFVNLGFCRYGRSLHYAFVKDLLSRHQPACVVLEVNEKESRFSHPDFPYVADGRDLIFPVFRQGYLQQLVMGVQARFEFNLRKWMHDLPSWNQKFMDENHLYVPHPQKGDPRRLSAMSDEAPKRDGP